MNRLGFILMLLAVFTSAAMAQNWAFTDVTAELGLTPAASSTAAWGDMDNDGDLDLFIGGPGESESYLYLNLNGELMDVSELYGLRDLRTEFVTKAEWFDYNRDGRLDLTLLTDDSRGIVLLTQNATGFTATEVNGGIPFEEPVRAAVWYDANADGVVDLVVSNGQTADVPVTIFEQDQNEFIQQRETPFDGELTNVGAMNLVDYDFDGDIDVFFGSTGNGNSTAHFYRNVGDGHFEDWGARYNFPAKLAEYGAVWFDYNNDQKLDLFVPGSRGGTYLYQGTTVMGVDGLERVNMPGLTNTHLDMRYAHAVDANMDGWTDLFIVNAFGQGCALMINYDGERWQNDAEDVNLENLHFDNRACAWGDYDNDGDRDLLLLQGEGGFRLYRNDVDAHQFLNLRLVSRGSHIPLANCNVMVEFDHGKQIATTSQTLCSMAGDDERVTLINRDDRKTDDLALTVMWPNGVVRRYDITDFRMRQINTLYEPLVAEEPVAIEPVDVPVPVIVSHGITPNPFNPTTTIRFTLSAAADVRLEVYNLVGQQVATLVQGSLAEGEHRVAFGGANLPSGLYFTRLTAGDMTVMNRMLLAK